MKQITISDVTLKEAVKNGSLLTFKEKLEIARLLEELKVDVIEVGQIADEKVDPVFLRTVATFLSNSTLCCDMGKTEKEARAAYEAIIQAAKKRLQLNVPVSPVQIEYKLHMKPDAVLKHISEMTRLAVSLGAEVEVSFEDVTRSEKEFLHKAILAALDSGAKIITLCELTGTILPDEFGAFVADIVAAVPELKKVQLLVSCMDEFKLAEAGYAAAIAAGANGVKTANTCSLIPSTEDFSELVKAIGLKKGIKTGLNLTAAGRIITQINALMKCESRPITKHAVEEASDRKIAADISREELGEVISGIGYEISPDDLAKVHEAYLRVSKKKRSVDMKELDAIIAVTAQQVPATYKLINYVINAGNCIVTTAAVTLERSGEELLGLAKGDGPIDAAFMAIESITGHRFELDEFQINAVTEGREAMGEALVKLRYNGKLYAGRGVSTDIVGASIRAYISALNKTFHEEKRV